jgi:hypothetical protein
MKNWKRLFWRFKGATLISNPHCLELWLDVGKRKNFKEVLAYAIEKEKEIIGEFSEWQHIFPINLHSGNPGNTHRLHGVLHEPALNKFLDPEIGKPSSSLTGLVRDKTPGNVPELQGPYSAEGMEGVDWLFLRAPHVIKAQNEALKSLVSEVDTLIELIKGQPKAPEGPGSGII